MASSLALNLRDDHDHFYGRRVVELATFVMLAKRASGI